jgi:hypothetical protein
VKGEERREKENIGARESEREREREGGGGERKRERESGGRESNNERTKHINKTYKTIHIKTKRKERKEKQRSARHGCQ